MAVRAPRILPTFCPIIRSAPMSIIVLVPDAVPPEPATLPSDYDFALLVRYQRGGGDQNSDPQDVRVGRVGGGHTPTPPPLRRQSIAAATQPRDE